MQKCAQFFLLFGFVYAVVLGDSSWPMMDGDPEQSCRTTSVLSRQPNSQAWNITKSSNDQNQWFSQGTGITTSADGSMFLTSTHGYLAKVGVDGQIRWQQQMPSIGLIPSNPVYLSSGAVCFSVSPCTAKKRSVTVADNVEQLYPTTFYCVSDANGQIINQQAVNVEVCDSPISYKGVLYFTGVTSNGMALLALDEQLNLLWTFNHTVKKWGGYTGAAISSTLNRIFFAANDALIAIDTNGNAVWSVPLSVNTAGSPSVFQDKVVLSNVNGDMILYNGQNGNVMWRVPGTSPGAGPASHSIDVNGVIYRQYVGLWAYNQQGTLLWNAAIPAFNSPMISADGKLYSAGIDGNIYCVDPRTGSIEWKFLSMAYLSAMQITSPNSIVVWSDYAILLSYSV